MQITRLVNILVSSWSVSGLTSHFNWSINPVGLFSHCQQPRITQLTCRHQKYLQTQTQRRQKQLAQHETPFWASACVRSLWSSTGWWLPEKPTTQPGCIPWCTLRKWQSTTFLWASQKSVKNGQPCMICLCKYLDIDLNLLFIFLNPDWCCARKACCCASSPLPRWQDYRDRWPCKVFGWAWNKCARPHLEVVRSSHCWNQALDSSILL